MAVPLQRSAQTCEIASVGHGITTWGTITGVGLAFAALLVGGTPVGWVSTGIYIAVGGGASFIGGYYGAADYENDLEGCFPSGGGEGRGGSGGGRPHSHVQRRVVATGSSLLVVSIVLASSLNRTSLRTK